MGYNERTGHWPLIKAKAKPTERKNSGGDTSESDTEMQHAKKADGYEGGFMTKVRSVSS